MPKCTEHKPKSFQDLIGIIESIQSKSKNSLWFRGCGDSEYKLVPSLYRHSTTKNIKDFIELEYQLMTRFRQRSIPFHSKTLSDDWDALFFMQHHGIPTRLLDWTENPFVAVFFSVMTSACKFHGSKCKYEKAATIWLLDPVQWNQHSLRHESFDGGILTTWDDQIKGYKPLSKFKTMNALPVTLYGAHNSPRIVAQRGVFVIFGESMNPMEDVYVQKNYPKDCLQKIVLNISTLPKIRRSILNHGITESVIFPDLVGLAQEIKRLYNFKE